MWTYPAWIVGLFTCGMVVALLGSVKMALAGRLEIDEGRVGGLVSIFGFAMIPVMLVMGFLTDLLDKQVVMVGGAMLILVSLVVLSRATTYGMALLAVFLLSAGWSGMVNVLNVLMVPAFGGSAVYAMNLGNFFFGAGAFVTPLAVVYLLGRADLMRTLLLLGVVPLLAVAGGLMVDFTALAPPAVEGAAPAASLWADVATLLGNPVMWLCALALLFYAPMEATMAAWATTFLADMGATASRASYLLSAFWLAFMAGRLGTALVELRFPLPAGGDTLLIVGLSVLCIVAWGIAVASRSTAMAGTAVVLAGLVFGPTFPTIVGVLLGSVDPALGGRAVGLFFAIGGIGWSLIPMAIGAYAKKRGVQKAFMIAVGAAVGLTCVAAVLHFAR